MRGDEACVLARPPARPPARPADERWRSRASKASERWRGNRFSTEGEWESIDSQSLHCVSRDAGSPICHSRRLITLHCAAASGTAAEPSLTRGACPRVACPSTLRACANRLAPAAVAPFTADKKAPFLLAMARPGLFFMTTSRRESLCLSFTSSGRVLKRRRRRLASPAQQMPARQPH